MVANVPFNPMVTTTASGSFNITSSGYVQGFALDDPTARNQLVGGVLADSETIPMWGGIAIYENVAGNPNASYIGNPSGPSGDLGGLVGRATTVTGGSKPITGFSVFNQAQAGITTPQSQVPLVGSKMQVMLYRLGSLARIAVKCDPALSSYSSAQLITVALAWDFVNEMLIAQDTSINISAAAYDSPSGVVTLTLASSGGITAGTTFTTASITGTGATNVNGTFTAIAGTSGTTVKFQLGTGLSISGLSGGTFTTGAALVGVKLLDVNIGTGMSVTYDPTSGFASWNRNGNTAIIQI